jgi:hypothetical protein
MSKTVQGFFMKRIDEEYIAPEPKREFSTIVNITRFAIGETMLENDDSDVLIRV